MLEGLRLGLRMTLTHLLFFFFLQDLVTQGKQRESVKEPACLPARTPKKEPTPTLRAHSHALSPLQQLKK